MLLILSMEMKGALYMEYMESIHKKHVHSTTSKIEGGY